MNKIKVLYDVIKTMKKKELINGMANLEVINGETKVVSLSNEFTKNNASGEIKAKISHEINMDGNKVKQETNIEFNIKEHPFHKFHQAHMGHGKKLSKVLLMLNALNNLRAEEKDDKTVLSLDLKEILKEVKELRTEYQMTSQECEAKHGDGHHKHPEFIKKIFAAEYEEAVLNITVSKASEIEKIEVSANGENIVNGSVNFIW